MLLTLDMTLANPNPNPNPNPNQKANVMSSVQSSDSIITNTFSLEADF